MVCVRVRVLSNEFRAKGAVVNLSHFAIVFYLHNSALHSTHKAQRSRWKYIWWASGRCVNMGMGMVLLLTTLPGNDKNMMIRPFTFCTRFKWVEIHGNSLFTCRLLLVHTERKSLFEILRKWTVRLVACDAMQTQNNTLSNGILQFSTYAFIYSPSLSLSLSLCFVAAGKSHIILDFRIEKYSKICSGPFMSHRIMFYYFIASKQTDTNVKQTNENVCWADVKFHYSFTSSFFKCGFHTYIFASQHCRNCTYMAMATTAHMQTLLGRFRNSDAPVTWQLRCSYRVELTAWWIYVLNVVSVCRNDFWRKHSAGRHLQRNISQK